MDLIVGGHTNTFLWNGPLPENIKFRPIGTYPTVVVKGAKQVLVVQTNGYGRYLGNLDISFNSEGEVISWSKQPILLTNSLPVDHNLTSMVDFYRSEVMNKMDKKLGNSRAALDGERSTCRVEECSFGNFLADAMADEMGVKIAFVNSGSIRSSFYEGN